MTDKADILHNLTRFRDSIKQSSGAGHVFDLEDLTWIQVEMDRVRDFDSELEVLDFLIRRREAMLSQLSEQLGLTQNHPDLMTQFAEKQEHYHTVREELLRAREMSRR
jgi:hypothetical protein